MGSGKRNYKALRYNSRKWRKEDTFSEIKEKKELTEEQIEAKKKAIEELTALYEKGKKGR